MNQERHSTAHLQQPLPNLNQWEQIRKQYRIDIFKSLINERIAFMKDVPIGCTTNLCSDNRRTSNDISMYTGSGGYLLLHVRFYEFFLNMDYEEMLQFIGHSQNLLPDEQIKQLFSATHHLDLAVKQFVAMEGVIQNLKEEDITFCFSQASTWLLGAKISYYKGDIERFKMYVNRVISISDKILNFPDKFEYEVLYGVPGYLYIVLALQKQFAVDHIDPLYKLDYSAIIIQLCYQIVRFGLESTHQKSILEQLMNKSVNLNNLKLRYPFHNRSYLGGAHGLLGAIQMLLLSYELCGSTFKQTWPEFTNILIKSITDSLDFVAQLVKSKGNVPNSEEKLENVQLFQFCHGTPGATSPFVKAGQLFQNKGYIETARLCAESIWKYGMLRKGPGICHGISGNAYSFLQVYQETKDPIVLHYAYTFLQYKQNPQIMQEIAQFDFKDRKVKGIPDHPYSLMEGNVGQMCALMDFNQFVGLPGYDL